MVRYSCIYGIFIASGYFFYILHRYYFSQNFLILMYKKLLTILFLVMPVLTFAQEKGLDQQIDEVGCNRMVCEFYFLSNFPEKKIKFTNHPVASPKASSICWSNPFSCAKVKTGITEKRIVSSFLYMSIRKF